jgi:hypothetical protein
MYAGSSPKKVLLQVPLPVTDLCTQRVSAP